MTWQRKGPGPLAGGLRADRSRSEFSSDCPAFPGTMQAPAFGAACIVTDSQGRYRPDRRGEYAAIIGVNDRYGELVDLVAWMPDDSWRWWLRHGDETPVLGARALAISAYDHEPITLHSTPERWLVSGRRRACVLTWDADLRGLFEGVSRVDCDLPKLRTRLQRALRQWEPILNLVKQEGLRDAA